MQLATSRRACILYDSLSSNAEVRCALEFVNNLVST